MIFHKLYKIHFMRKGTLQLICLFIISSFQTFYSQTHSVSREWNSMILEAIRNDYARPTVHARNLYHHSIIAYDAWAAFDPAKKTFFLGDTLHGFYCAFDGIPIPEDIDSAREIAISFASYRFIIHRYQNSPDYAQTFQIINNYMTAHNYDIANTSLQYQNGPEELGNYLAAKIIEYGYTDGSNEINSFANTYYTSANPPIEVELPGNPLIQDPNRWQAITLSQSIDQSGNIVTNTPEHLSPEWGNVHPFALVDSMYTIKVRDGQQYKIYLDPGDPAFIDINDTASWTSFYKWNHTLVSIWQSHLDPTDGVLWDISPASIGNVTNYPDSISDFHAFYDLLNGGDPGTGYSFNPITGQPYTPQIVPRGDYARVLAEFWADGIDSETPPGHWFEIYHYVLDQPGFETKWQGVGPVLDPLEFDVKTHLALGGAVHDAAICAWGIKGYYDYIRPVSAIRYMADMGQSSDTTLSNYSPAGIPLLPGYIEVVQAGDSLAGQWNEHVGKIKLYTWKGHEYINDPLTDVAGVGWILAENWWPYQRPSFVTPPFAGYVSGHSTYSRAAAELLTLVTGSPYFPNGMGVFHAQMNEFLHFEDGPSMDIELQWAKYSDASDQCSLSRLWGGIHPPIDDIPGRKIGMIVGPQAFYKADSIYDQAKKAVYLTNVSDHKITVVDFGNTVSFNFHSNVAVDINSHPFLLFDDAQVSTILFNPILDWVDSFNFTLTYQIDLVDIEFSKPNIKLSGVVFGDGTVGAYWYADFFIIDTHIPEVLSCINSFNVLNDQVNNFNVDLKFSERMDVNQIPVVDIVPTSLGLNSVVLYQSAWISDSVCRLFFHLLDNNEEISDDTLTVVLAYDFYGNQLNLSSFPQIFNIETKNPSIVGLTLSDNLINIQDIQSPTIEMTAVFDEKMNVNLDPLVHLNTISCNNCFTEISSIWINDTTYTAKFELTNYNLDYSNIDIQITSAQDLVGNEMVIFESNDAFIVDVVPPQVEAINLLNDSIGYNHTVSGYYDFEIYFSEKLDTTVFPFIQHQHTLPLNTSLQFDINASHYLNDSVFLASFIVYDADAEIESITLQVSFAKDLGENVQIQYAESDFISLDTRNPEIIALNSNTYTISGIGELIDCYVIFNEPMHPGYVPQLTFSVPEVSANILALNSSYWLSNLVYVYNYEVVSGLPYQVSSDAIVSGARDMYYNEILPSTYEDFFAVELLGLDEIASNNIKVYPNPTVAGGNIYLQGSDQLNSVTDLGLFNLLGQKIDIFTRMAGDLMIVDLPENISSGIYLLKSDQIQFSHRIVVK